MSDHNLHDKTALITGIDQWYRAGHRQKLWRGQGRGLACMAWLIMSAATAVLLEMDAAGASGSKFFRR